jgi:hypothetical protein
MKRASGIMMMMAGLFVMTASVMVQAQGRGHHRGHAKHNKQKNDFDYDHDDRHDHYGSHQQCSHEHYHVRPASRPVKHIHHRDCDHRTVVVEYHRPRYIYYRDYNVYYDCHRSVYIVFSGRGWTISASTPVCLNRVDIHRANRMDVEYEGDDFPDFLTRRDRTSYNN